MWASLPGWAWLHQVLGGAGKKGLEGDAEIRSAWASFLLLALGHGQAGCDGRGHQETGYWLCIQKKRKMGTDGLGPSAFHILHSLNLSFCILKYTGHSEGLNHLLDTP